ncbi:putative RNA recognition motif domain-containing protein [Lupinus albus]|uniref:Putative RNA recognition motif domain-containing protein n=1 Tax=Lupinus albus TaxID=3870 RepID=A0A6A4PJL2_LUPAL|nr:putative RNA recognition motif domain-containing protein [Lupinus albus]
MSSGGYSVEVTGLSSKATENDVHDFFAFSGIIEHVEIIRSGGYACTAYVTFKDAYYQETACLLSGATILDQRVCITRWGQYEAEFDFWNHPSHNHAEETSSTTPQISQFVSSAGEAVTVAQEVVKTMLAKGYILSKDALATAKDFDESYQVSATATAKVSELSQRIGLTDKISAGVEAVRSVDQKYNVSETAKTAASATGRSVAAAANYVVNSSYFSKGALWMSGSLTRAAQAASDLGTRNGRQ